MLLAWGDRPHAWRDAPAPRSKRTGMAEPADAIRYRELAEIARRSAGRSLNDETRLAYEHIAEQYDQLALEVDAILAKLSRQGPRTGQR